MSNSLLESPGIPVNSTQHDMAARTDRCSGTRGVDNSLSHRRRGIGVAGPLQQLGKQRI